MQTLNKQKIEISFAMICETTQTKQFDSTAVQSIYILYNITIAFAHCSSQGLSSPENSASN